jgi:hypothetical protein
MQVLLANATTGSTHSRRIYPISLSAKQFCHADPADIGPARMPMVRNPRLPLPECGIGFKSALGLKECSQQLSGPTGCRSRIGSKMAMLSWSRW